MTTYTKVEKETATYTKVDKTQEKGQFKSPWFFSWFKPVEDFYHKVTKALSTYTKINKE